MLGPLALGVSLVRYLREACTSTCFSASKALKTATGIKILHYNCLMIYSCREDITCKSYMWMVRVLRKLGFLSSLYFITSTESENAENNSLGQYKNETFHCHQTPLVRKLLTFDITQEHTKLQFSLGVVLC